MNKRIRLYNVEDITSPLHQWVNVVRDRWWPTTPDGQVAVWVGYAGTESPICNLTQNIADHLNIDGLSGPAVFIPLAFTRHEC